MQKSEEIRCGVADLHEKGRRYKRLRRRSPDLSWRTRVASTSSFTDFGQCFSQETLTFSGVQRTLHGPGYPTHERGRDFRLEEQGKPNPRFQLDEEGNARVHRKADNEV